MSNRRSSQLVLMVVMAVLVGVVPAGATERDDDDSCGAAPRSGFSDVPESNVHRRRIDCIKHYGITQGKTATTYQPSGVLTRDQLAAFLDRTLTAGSTPVPAATQDWFDDDDGNVHEPSINRLAEAGILATTTRTFGPKVNPSRAEMSRLTATMLEWAGVIPGGGSPPNFYTDDAKSSDEDAINRLADAGIVTGKGVGTFAPNDLLTRAQMATFLARSIDALLDGAGSHHHCRISTPERPRFDAFYTQECHVFGISVVGSNKVAPEALRAAVDVFVGLLGQAPDVHAQLGRDGFYLILLGEEEGQTDPPEYRDLKNDPNTDWDARARGLGGDDYASAGEENALCRPSDRYNGESILVHEFSHSVLTAGLERARPGFRSRVEAAYADAMATGKWQNTYAATNVDEYWAEGVQSWVDANAEASPPNGIHNHVNTREELIAYDSQLADLIAEGLGNAWRYACP